MTSRSERIQAKKKSSWKRKLLWTALAIFIFVGGVSFYYIYEIIKFGNNIKHSAEDSRFQQTDSSEESFTPPVWEGEERVNILLIGADDRGLSENQMPRSDTMMVMSVDPKTERATLFSILRDTYANIPGYGYQRANAALALGGPDLAMETVSHIMDMPIQYYVYVDFEGFVALIDALGGIEYEVESDMYYTSRADGPEFDINLKAGLQKLDGSKALQYVRFRGDRQSDYGRTERQRNLLKAVANEMQSTTSIIRLPIILDQIHPYIETNLNLKNMLSLGALALNVKTDQMNTIQLPPPELVREQRIGGADVITYSEDQLKAYVQDALLSPSEADTVLETEDELAPEGES